jgi:ATP-dependent 26S proteasome regulatory subunit
MNALRKGASTVGKSDFETAIKKVLGDEIEGSEEALRMFS